MLKGSPVILCGECIVPPEKTEMLDDAGQIQCPVCQKVDTVENALEDARRHATHAATRELERKMEKGGRVLRSRTPTRAPIKNLRWVSNLA